MITFILKNTDSWRKRWEHYHKFQKIFQFILLKFLSPLRCIFTDTRSLERSLCDPLIHFSASSGAAKKGRSLEKERGQPFRIASNFVQDRPLPANISLSLSPCSHPLKCTIGSVIIIFTHIVARRHWSGDAHDQDRRDSLLTGCRKRARRGTTGTGRKVGLQPNPGPVGPATSRRPLRNYANPLDEQRGRSLALLHVHIFTRVFKASLRYLETQVGTGRTPESRTLFLSSLSDHRTIDSLKIEASRDVRTLIRSIDFSRGSLFSRQKFPNPRYLREKESSARVFLGFSESDQ